MNRRPTGMESKYMDDNKSNQTEADNKANAPESPLPNLVPEQPKPEPEDPEYSAFVSKVGDMKTAFKEYKNLESRYSGSSAEAKRLAQVEQEKQAIVTELQGMMARNPKLAEEIQKEINGVTTQPTSPTPPALAPEDAETLRQVRATQQAQAQREIYSFRDVHKEYIKDENDWERVKDIAVALDGKRDANNVPYSLTTALQAAIRVIHPEIISDKAMQSAMTQSRMRDSASEPGDMPSGYSSSEPSLDADEETLIGQLSSYGVTREGYLKRKAQNL